MYNAECTIFGLKDLSMQIENADSRRKSTEKIGVDLREKKKFISLGWIFCVKSISYDLYFRNYITTDFNFNSKVRFFPYLWEKFKTG